VRIGEYDETKLIGLAPVVDPIKPFFAANLFIINIFLNLTNTQA